MRYIFLKNILFKLRKDRLNISYLYGPLWSFRPFCDKRTNTLCFPKIVSVYANVLI